MASFTTVPARRLRYDLDGSVVKYWTDAIPTTEITGTNLTNINDIGITNNGLNMGYVYSSTICVVFPQKRDIYRYFISISSGIGANYSSINISTDTTDGINGTWNTLTAPTPNGVYTNNILTNQWYDDSYVSGTLTGATGIKGIKISIYIPSGSSATLQVFNLWGNINDATATGRLDFTDVSGNSLTQDIFYNTQRSQTDVTSLYLKNLYTNATSQIVFSINGEFTTVNANTTISVDGGTTYNALPYTWVTSLASGAVSSEIKCKYVVPSAEPLGIKYYGIQATPTFV